jgi:hypothetical protein
MVGSGMPRQKAPSDTTVLAVRVPNELAAAVILAAGGQAGFAEWARNVYRRALNKPLNYDAGYAEGKAAGWAKSNERFREALRKAT